METEERLAREISEIYKSGRQGIVLETSCRQEWEKTVDFLQRETFGGLAAAELRWGRRAQNGTPVYAPGFYQRLSIPRLLDWEDLEEARPGQYLAMVLERLAGDKGVGLLLLADFHLLPPEARTVLTAALVQLLSRGEKDGPLFLITVEKRESLPEALFPCVRVLSVERPDAATLDAQVERIGKEMGLCLPLGFRREIVSYLQGFHSYEVAYLFSRAARKYGAAAFDPVKRRVLELISAEKVKLLDRDRLLEWKAVRQVDMANMEILARYLEESGRILANLDETAREGVDTPKGILITGLPGTGKSLFALYAAAKLKLPLLRLEMGRMMGGLVGDSERNLRNAQRQAEEMAPCILWIDEIEKGFSGIGREGKSEGAYLQRMAGSFLTWLQEKKSSCYLIATANSLEGLPVEFFRKGRFDECFYTSMPTERELKEILRVHLSRPERRHVLPKAEEAIAQILRSAAAGQRFMTGADAGALVSNAFRRLYLDYHDGNQEQTMEKKEYDQKNIGRILLEEFKKLRVFGETNGDEIAVYHKAIRKLNFIRASEKGEETNYDLILKDFIADRLARIEERGTFSPDPRRP